MNKRDEDCMVAANAMLVEALTQAGQGVGLMGNALLHMRGSPVYARELVGDALDKARAVVRELEIAHTKMGEIGKSDKAPNRIDWAKLPPVATGYQRTWCACKECGHVAYRDYQPFSLSNPVLTLPCGHGLSSRFSDGVRNLSEEEARALTSEESS